MITRGRVSLRDIHADNQAVAESVRMVDGGVEQEVAFLIVDNLVHFDSPIMVFVGLDPYRLDVRVKRNKLTCPISANLIPPMDVAALHTVRPLHVGMHA